MKEKDLVETGEKIVKQKMKPRGGNSPVIGDNGIHTKPGDNAKIAKTLAEIISWGKVDKSNVEELEERFWKFVKYCADNDVRIGNQTAYLAMGISKDDVYHWENGATRSSEHRDLIKKVKAFCAAYREILGAEGKLNPVTLVWWQKNYDGLVDKQEVVVTPNSPLGAEPDRRLLEEKMADIVIDNE